MNVIDVSKWPREHADHRHTFWWGILLLIVVEATVVAAFVTSYFYLWTMNVAEKSGGWPPAGTELPPLVYPSINTVLLILCSISMWWGGVVMERGQARKFFWLVVFCSIAGIVVLYLRWLQFLALPFDWKLNSYASFVWTLTGFHFVHLSSAVLGTIVIGWFAYKGYYTKERMLGVQVDTMYWYFVTIAWVPIYLVLYWTPRLF